ncbi:MAG: class I SAM-dependent methyltransferase [Microcoleaceae cyanobacterium MO_207.B10]|nr:class I SAM-dependent methyltransferase [Microcoleaceae cyanobacterium MO_207.B10]
MMSITNTIIVCPICHLNLVELPQNCTICLNNFRNKITKIPENFIDLTPESIQTQSQKKSETKPLRTQLFRSQIIPLLYERILPPIWAMGLRNLGGMEVEFGEVKQFFGNDSEVVVDISCGSGIMARQLIKTGKYKQVIALDYSEFMLNELQQKMKQENIPLSKIMLIRGDVEMLPFADNSIEAIYSGAAMHCWPNTEQGINNIYRVLSTGGKLFATTFMKPLPSIVFRFFSVDELLNIMLKAGFVQESLEVEKRGVYGIIKCRK